MGGGRRGRQARAAAGAVGREGGGRRGRQGGAAVGAVGREGRRPAR
jgi:hypothetical protein